ncbi:O-antigen ligase family protein [Chitinimonas arctica]|uniref:O-antigen ligase family protein n=1 Tax=Chitinimonas arctica TaxID=2594795 RepID=A0A516SEV3_9NEIS|nr:O-antigen ligase family protein [Chitinimonas arctica]QDQ26673.1 O-antigen ligase family protein [Chitinimonas arctica]
MKKNKVPLWVLIFGMFYAVITGLAVALFPWWMGALFVPPLFVPLLFRGFISFEPPTALLTALLFGSLGLFLLWPRYLAFQLAGPDITPQRLVHMVLILVWMISLTSPIFRDTIATRIKQHPKTIALLGFLLFLRVGSAILSDYPLPSIYSLINELMSGALVFFMILSLVDRQEKVEGLAKLLLYCGLVMGLLTLYEFATKSVIFSQVHIPGMKLDSEYLVQALADKSRSGSYRAQSTFANPLLLAEFAVFLLPIAFYFLAMGRGLVRKVALFSVPLLIVTEYCTGSRAGLAVLAVILLAATVIFARGLMTSRRMGAVGWMLVVAIVMSGMAAVSLLAFVDLDLSYFQGRSLTEVQSSNARIQMMEKGIPLILDKPIFGYGISRAAVVLGFIGTNRMLTIDNFYLSYALDAGLIALCVFFAFMFTIMYTGVRASMNPANKQGGLGVFLALSIAGMLMVMSIVSLDYNIPLLFIAAALILVISRNDSSTAKEKLI